MQLRLTSDQEFFRETTAKFLSDLAPVEDLRRRRHDPDGFSPDYWRRGAELGWTSLLVAEEHGGGSISGDGLADLVLVAHEFGRHAAPGPLIPTNIVAAALSAAGTSSEVLAGLLAGTSVAAWCLGEPAPRDGMRDISLQIGVDGDEVVLNGTKRPVEAAAQASHLLVTGRTGDGLTQVLIPTGTSGVSVEPMHSVDLTRRFGLVRFDDVRVASSAVVGEVGKADEAVDQQLRHALVLLTAESVGAMDTAFDLTLRWAFDRFSFGRPLASYQALKHRFADMKTWLEASHAITDDATTAVAERAPNADQVLSAAKAYVGEYGSELLQDCVQLHGGIGVTFEHDLHLYLRRHTVNRALYGTPAEHRRHLTDLLERQDRIA